MKDKWGALPLFYALWGNAPSDVVQFLLESYKSIYPTHAFDWGTMVKTLGRASAPSNVIQRLLDVQEECFPQQCIDWDIILEQLDEPTDWHSKEAAAHCVTFRYLISHVVTKRMNKIGLKQWRDEMADKLDEWSTPGRKGHDEAWRIYRCGRKAYRADIMSKLAHYETEYQKLLEATSVLELVLWKIKIDDSDCRQNEAKKMKMDDAGFRKQCRISCGADHVIRNVLPYILPPLGLDMKAKI